MARSYQLKPARMHPPAALSGTNETSATCRVSVVIPTFNRANRVARAIESAQSALPGAEILVVDDGSTDGTDAVVAPMGVQYLRQENRGAGSARNLGLQSATGQYVVLLDSDDRLIDGAHLRLMDQLDFRPEVAVGFPGCRFVTSTGESRLAYAAHDTLWSVPNTKVGDGYVLFDQKVFFRQLILDRCYVHISSVIRRSALDELGLFNTDLRGYEEWDLYIRLASKYSFLHSTTVGVEVEKHDANMSNDIAAMMVEGVRILEGVLGGTVKLDPAERLAVRKKLSQWSFGPAYAAFDRGDLADSRRLFADHISRFGLSTRALLYLAASSLPASVVSSLRRLKRTSRSSANESS